MLDSIFNIYHQARKQGAYRWGEAPLQSLSHPLEDCVGHSETIGHSLKILGPSQKTLRHP